MKAAEFYRPTRRRPGFAVLLVINVAFAAAIALELSGRLFVFAFESLLSDYRASADGYENADWPAAYYRELRSSGETSWRPYVYWRREPFNGHYISIDNEGLRRTWQSSSSEANSRRILVMGGSTVWGTGSRDEFTLPSELAKAFDRAGRPATVVNHGESGYVSGQSLAALVAALRNGDRPTMVVFYGGVEDTYSAQQNSIAGIPQNEINRRHEFNSSQPWALDQLWTNLFSGSVRASSLILQRPSGTHTYLQPSEIDELARGVLDAYCLNVRAADALGKEFGFEVIAFWQPVIFTKPNLTSYERQEAARQESSRSFFELTYRIASSRPPSCQSVPFHDISAIFENVEGPRFLDAMHVTERAHREVAAAIAPLAISRFASR